MALHVEEDVVVEIVEEVETNDKKTRGFFDFLDDLGLVKGQQAFYKTLESEEDTIVTVEDTVAA